MDTTLLRPISQTDMDDFRSQHPEIFGSPEIVTFVFAGSHAVYMDLIGLLKALDLLRKETENFRFIFIGHGDDKQRVVDFAAELDLNKFVVFLPYQQRNELVKYICAADFCYSSTIDAPIYQMVIATKVLEYLACNKFVVSVHDGPFTEHLEALGHTITAFPERSAEIKDTLKKLIVNREHYQKNITGREFIEAEFSQHRFHERMLEFFADLVPPQK
jgi:glycosyltransferase involved in cell wall biosynthesis